MLLSCSAQPHRPGSRLPAFPDQNGPVACQDGRWEPNASLTVAGAATDLPRTFQAEAHGVPY